MSSSSSRLRGRPRKDGGRMDAAIEAMDELGFPPKFVYQTVKELLEVYGVGGSGWRFIEEGAYSVLIEALLEKQQQQQDAAPPEQDHAQQLNNLLDEALPEEQQDAAPPQDHAQQENGPEQLEHEQDSAQVEHNTQHEQDVAIQGNPEGTVAIQESPRGNVAVQGSPSSHDAETPAPRHATDERSGRKNISVDSCSEKQQMISESGKEDDTPAAAKRSGSLSQLYPKSPPLPVGCKQGLPSSVDSTPKPRRKPFYGWISDNEDGQDFIDLEPAPLPSHLQKIVDRMMAGRSEKQRSRWDLKPEGM